MESLCDRRRRGPYRATCNPYTSLRSVRLALFAESLIFKEFAFEGQECLGPVGSSAASWTSFLGVPQRGRMALCHNPGKLGKHVQHYFHHSGLAVDKTAVVETPRCVSHPN